jgi:hypothetical protein
LLIAVRSSSKLNAGISAHRFFSSIVSWGPTEFPIKKDANLFLHFVRIGRLFGPSGWNGFSVFVLPI